MEPLNGGSSGKSLLDPSGSLGTPQAVPGFPFGIVPDHCRDRSGAMGAAADAEWLRWVSKQFGNVAGKEKEISLEEFKSALQVKESFFAERFFALFDSDGSGSLSREELLGSLRRLLRGNSTEKLRFLFQVYDVDGSGSIDAEELLLVLRGCLRESSLALPEERLRALSQALLQALDRDRSGSITFPELQEQLEAFPELLENLSISAASWLKPPSPSPAEHWLCCFSRESCRDQRAGLCCFSRESCRDQRAGLCCFSRESCREQRAGLCCLGSWLAISALLLALGALGHRERGPALALARGCGQSLNFNCALLAALVLRRSLTWLRRSPLAALFPLELHLRGHERVAHLVLALATAHGGAHLAHAGVARRDWPVALGEYLRWPRPGAGGVGGSAPQTGLALLALLLAMLLCSSPCVRRGGHFEVFYWSHLSYISVWFLLLLHGPHFWKWFLIPGSLFFLEKVLGWVWRRAGDLHILEAKLLPSKVTHLVIQRPKSFRFQPGDYVYLNVPAIAAYEWHPFSISSAPEQPETLWLHIRARGQWTTKLYEYFQQLESHGPEPNPPGKSRREHWEQVGLWDWDQGKGMGAAGWGWIPWDHPSSKLGNPSGWTFPACPALKDWCPMEWDWGWMDGWHGPWDQGDPAELQRQALPHWKTPVLSHPLLAPTKPWEFPNPMIPSPLPGSCSSTWKCWICAESGSLLSRDLSQCFLDGPYGTPSRRIFTSEHAVLIGAGIGITPFASILQSIMFRYRRRRQSCPSCHFTWNEERRDEEMTLRKVDFIWITRDQQHLQWFLGLLAQLESEQAELEPGGNFLELHLYMTSALGKGDVKALGLQLALDLLAAQEKRDSISGLRSRTQPGRPDWAKVFGKVAAERRGKVQVFFCGSAGLAKVIHGHCRSFGFRFSKENF
ncbi:NADPH oxidase 5 [Catharus ustulatus]|uniref:NADPH oxidase 5 n=1 Tax=Catharus ustulatus TaxID=91951 RepID=UPI001C5BC198|nr:NADPH oxidase 5 [Catharus ustulatus]